MALRPYLKEIADAIREKDGTTEPIPAPTFPERIRAIESGGGGENDFTIEVTSNNPEKGSVQGGGLASAGMDITVLAIPNDSYTFSNWTENGFVVSEDRSYRFIVDKNRSLVANFIDNPYELGVNWQENPYPSIFTTSNSHNARIAYGNNIFVMTTSESDNTMRFYSEDGLNWTQIQTALPFNGPYWLTFTHDRFFMWPSSGSNYAYSFNGKDWEAGSFSSFGYYRSLTWGAGKYIIVGKRGTSSSSATTQLYAYSTDGVNWTDSNLPSVQYWNLVAYGNNIFVVKTENNNVFAFSKDGLTWEQRTFDSSVTSTYNFSFLFFGEGKFVAGTTNFYAPIYSNDGINWHNAESYPTTNPRWYFGMYANGVYIVTGTYAKTTYYLYSTDGVNWVRKSFPFSAYWEWATYGKNKLIVVAERGTRYVFSPPDVQ